MTLRSITTALLGLGLGAGLIGAPAFAEEVARPGTVNYVEGAAYIDGQPLNAKQIGSLDLQPGQELTTANGRAEILLTPGVFLRVDKNSAVKMISPDLVQTQVQLDKGRVGVEVDEIHDENNLQIIDAGVNTRLLKNGYYEFSANNPEVEVFKGKAEVQVADGRTREVKGHHELLLAGAANGEPLAKEKPASFNEGQAEDALFNWSKLRSHYLAEANNEMAGDYADAGYGPGWYWNPYGLGYTFIGGGPFMSPFGWGFYPLGWGWGGGWYGGWGGGWYGRPYYHGGHPYDHDDYGHGGVGHGFTGHGFHGGGMRGFHGAVPGGFHGGMSGGFHGGGGRR